MYMEDINMIYAMKYSIIIKKNAINTYGLGILDEDDRICSILVNNWPDIKNAVESLSNDGKELGEDFVIFEGSPDIFRDLEHNKVECDWLQDNRNGTVSLK